MLQLISQVFAELPFLDDNFQTNCNPRNLGVSTSEIQVVYKFSKGHSVILSLAFLASCKRINHKSKSIKIHWSTGSYGDKKSLLTRRIVLLRNVHLMWQVVTRIRFGLSKAFNKRAYQEFNSSLILNHDRKTFTNCTLSINLEPKRIARVKIN